jgi:hypothetical protein
MLGVLLIIGGLLLIAYGANVLTLAVLPPTEITKDGITVKWSRAGDYAVQLTITVPKDSYALVGYRIYVWVYRVAEYKMYDAEAKTWIFKETPVTLYGSGGSTMLRPFNENGNSYVYTYIVDFKSAMSSYSSPGYFTTGSWQFSQWLNVGYVEVYKTWLKFELPIPSQVASTEPSELTSQSQTENVTPQETPTTPPPETPDVTVSTQVKILNYGCIFLGAVLCVAGLWTATKKP